MTNATGVSITLKDIERSFGSVQVLRNLDYQIDPGEFIAIVGRSGSGKSTLLRVIAALERLDEGTILIDDRPVHSIPAQMRMMFQEGRLLPWLRVIDNIALGLPRTRRSDAEQLLARVGLEDRGQDWPAKLSGGQRQRVALARALAADPWLLLLDEPLGSLDALTRMEMQSLIEELWMERRFTAVLITHDVEEAVLLADRVLLLEQGRITGDWPNPAPRPRNRSSTACVELADTILKRIFQSTT